MNIDERLEALTQSVELLASFHRDNEAAMRKLDEKLSEKIDKLTDNIDRIAQLVLAHEHRIKDIETGRQ